MMYLRLAALVAIFNRNLISILGAPFLVLAGASIACGWLWSRVPDAKAGDVEREFEPKNPLELRAALGFAILFVTMLVTTHLVVTYLGNAGVYSLAALDGRNGRGSVHHGNDAVRRRQGTACRGGGGDFDCRLQQ
jgi:uncharacterized membrane protein (DUF4010 family)